MLQRRPLFGGAIEVSLPPSFLDVSTFRQVPDNQEVFVEADSERSLMVDLLEWEEEVPLHHLAEWHFRQLAQDNQALEAHLEHVEPLPAIDPSRGNGECVGFLAIGSQVVRKFPSSPTAAGAAGERQGRWALAPTKRVRMYLGVFRDMRYALDYLLVLNVPLEGEVQEVEEKGPRPSSTSDAAPVKEAQSLAAGGEDRSTTTTSQHALRQGNCSMLALSLPNGEQDGGTPGPLPGDVQHERDVFLAICQSFRILDGGLFAI